MIWANGVATPYYPGSGCTDYGGSTMTGPNACAGCYTTSTWFSGGGVGGHAIRAVRTSIVC